MQEEENRQEQLADEIDEAVWPRVYVAVILTTTTVIALLWYFSAYFSS
jgi:hypothetical protein